MFFFEFGHFFYSLLKILIDELYYIINGICADMEQAKAFWFSEGRMKV